ncbi:MAG: hypothetical protein WC101_01045 [Candidatus Gracilibacteria bacterium]
MKKFQTYIIAFMMTLVMTVPTVALAVVQTPADIAAEEGIDKIFKVQNIQIDGKDVNKNLKDLSKQVKSTQEGSFADVFAGIIKILSGVAVVMTFVGTVVAGVILVFSDGEEDKQTKAKTIIIYIAIGDVIIAASYAIVRAITLIKPL